MKGRGLKRIIIFIVFLIPIGWYLVLQLFGDNQFSLILISDMPEPCGKYDKISVIAKDDSLSIVEENYMNRVVYGSERRKANLIYESSNFFDCINQSGVDLVLVNEEGIWGTYKLSREGVDQLLTELDILTLQQTYGKGAIR